jgi:hypothetical protein
MCGESSSFLGRLGRLLHFRCPACGMIHNIDIDSAEAEGDDA